MATFSKKSRILILLFFLLNTGMQCKLDEQTDTPHSPPPVLVAGRALVGTVEGISIEPGGKTVLITSHRTNLLSRFDIETSEKTHVLYDDNTPFRMSGVVIESSGKTALVTRLSADSDDEGDLVRVDTATGAIAVIASGLRFYLDAVGIALEERGETALVAEMCQLTRVNLTDGTKTPVAIFECTDRRVNRVTDVAIESPGETAIVSQGGKGLWRVNLRTGERNLIYSLSCFDEGGLTVEPSRSRAFFGCSRGLPFGSQEDLFQVDLTTGAVVLVVQLAPKDLVIEEGGKTALATAGRSIYRVQLP